MKRPPILEAVLLPAFATPVRAGFPSPAEDYLEGAVDLARVVTAGRRGVRLVDLPDPAGRVPRLVLAVDPRLRVARDDVVLAIADGSQVVARFRPGPDGGRLSLPGGGILTAGEVGSVGVVTWAMRGFRDGPARGEGYSFLLPSPNSSFLFAVDGTSMRGAGIRDGDILVVDRALSAENGDVVVASVAGGRTVKRYVDAGGTARLAFEEREDDLRFLPLNPDDTVFGVVTWCLHRLRAPAAPRRGKARA